MTSIPLVDPMSVITPTVTPANIEIDSLLLPPPMPVQSPTPHTVSSLSKALVATTVPIPTSPVVSYTSPSVLFSPSAGLSPTMTATIVTAVAAPGATLATPASYHTPDPSTSLHGKLTAANLPQATTRPVRKQASANKQKS